MVDRQRLEEIIDDFKNYYTMMIGTDTQDKTYEDSAFIWNKLVVIDEYRDML